MSDQERDDFLIISRSKYNSEDQKSVDQDLVKLLDDARTKINVLEQALAVVEDALDNKYRLGFKDGHTCCMSIVKNLNYEVHIIIEALEVAKKTLTSISLNSCCGSCQESKLLAIETLEKIKAIKDSK